MNKTIAIILLSITLLTIDPVLAKEPKIYQIKQIITHTQSKWKERTPEQKKRFVIYTLAISTAIVALTGISFYGGLKVAACKYDKEWLQKSKESLNQWEQKAVKLNKYIRNGDLESVKQVLVYSSIEEENAYFDNACFQLEAYCLCKLDLRYRYENQKEIDTRTEIALRILQKSTMPETNKIKIINSIIDKLDNHQTIYWNTKQLNNLKEAVIEKCAQNLF